MDKNHIDKQKEHEQALRELQAYLDKREKERQGKEEKEEKRSKPEEKDSLSFSISDIFIIFLWMAIVILFFVAFIITDYEPFETPASFFIAIVLLIINIIYSALKTPKTNFQKANMVITTITTMIVAGPLILLFILSMPFLLIIPIILFIIYKQIPKDKNVEKYSDNNGTKDN